MLSRILNDRVFDTAGRECTGIDRVECNIRKLGCNYVLCVKQGKLTIPVLL